MYGGAEVGKKWKE